AEAVREAHRDEELLARLGVELVRDPLPERRRARPDVDGDVPDAPRHDADQLRLARLRLIVQAAQRVLDGARVVVLHEGAVDPGGGVAVEAVRLEEEPAIVLEDLGLQDLEPRQLELDDLHGLASPGGRSSSARRRYFAYWLLPYFSATRRSL